MTLTSLLRNLRSRRLAILLMAGLGLSLFAGTIIPQAGFTDPAQLQRWQSDYPGFTKLADILHLDSIYDSPWFIILLTLFFLNTLAYTMEKARQLTGRAEPGSVPVWPMLFEARTSMPPSQKHVVDTLARKQYRVSIDATSQEIEAMKGALSSVGSILLHAAVLLLFVAGTVTALTRFSGILEITEGQTVFDRQNAYVWSREAVFAKDTYRHFSLTLARFAPEYYPDGRHRSLESSVLFSDSTTQIQRSISVSSPVRYEGTALYQRDENGIACLFRIADSRGQLIDRSYVLFDKQEKFQFSTRYPVPALRWTIDAVLYPDAYSSPTGLGSRSYLLRGPALKLTIQDKERISFEGTLFPGDRISLGGSTFAWLDARYWSSYWVTRDRGEIIIQTAFLVGVAGLFLVIFFEDKRMRVIITGSGNDYHIKVIGKASRYPAAFQDEAMAIGSDLLRSEKNG